ncbi:hypothetical protein [Lentzea albidocapillata]|uniref:Uncharacterized protein n=1 Tax=Lentzea albidocapillata TaxID=40571 RepID=A0A1W2DHL2_9PSEU|nr:hypothetical protein [Lentzea albidocapillata]SMC96448.1 hypothetical protein SAMN05660733_03001 [Lentzea albidocapillata]
MRAAEEFTQARVFDVVDPETGPGFAPDHPFVDDPEERRALAAYLDSGTPILVTPTMMSDVVDPDRTAVVPTNFITDGKWVWTDTVTYYLREHGLAPEDGLLSHIREQGATAAPVDPQTAQRAVRFVLEPPAKAHRPVWKSV